MFFHNFKYSFKTLFKNRSLVFWTFAFPILLGLFFNMAFSDIEKSEKLSVIDIAIINNEKFQNNETFKSSFKSLSEGEDRIFNIKYVDESEAINLLEEKEISGYLLLNEEPKVVVRSSGIDQTILKYTTDEIMETSKIIETKVTDYLKTGGTDASSIIKDTVNKITNYTSNTKDISTSNLSYTMIEFYTLIAMACLYGGMLGMKSINQCLANMSNSGKRLAVSPVSKFKMILSSVLASYLTQIIGVALLILFTVFVLKVDYGDNIPLIICLSLVGSLAGLSIGVIIGILLKTNEDIKTGIVISVTMLGCFLSGMMGITMKYIVDKNVPIVNKLNPASMITDGFYALYYYDTLDRYYFNIISLLIFAFILLFISFISLRRQKYDSI